MCRVVFINNTTEKMDVERSVRFLPSDDDHNHVVIEPDFHLTEDDLKNIWWTREELKESNSDRKELLREFFNELSSNNDGSDLDESFSELYKLCSSSLTISQVMRTKAAKRILTVLTTTTSDLRGLEVKFSKWVSKHRKYHTQSVVQFCSQQGAKGAESNALASVSLKTSKASEMVARLLAHADARQARGE